MGKVIDSAALRLLDRVLGLAGTGAARTELEDSFVTQVLDIGPVVRRSRTILPSEGIYYFYFRFTHALADTQDQALDPYAPGALAVVGYPAVVPEGFDFWILGCGGDLNNTANFTAARFGLNISAQNFGAGVDQTGALSTPPNAFLPLVGFNAIEEVGGKKYLSNTATEQIYFPLGIRLRRGQTLYLVTVSGGGLIIEFIVFGCLLPSGLGQDAVT